MPDVYSMIADVDEETQERLAGILELRAADPQQRAMLDAYISEMDLASSTRVLEIGCGTGAVTRVLAAHRAVSEAVGIDPSPVFIAKARELAAGEPTMVFEEGDGRALPFPDEDFDAVVLHTTLCHIPQPEGVLGEASVFCAEAASLRSVTATTPRSPWRCRRPIRCRTASRR